MSDRLSAAMELLRAHGSDYCDAVERLEEQQTETDALRDKVEDLQQALSDLNPALRYAGEMLDAWTVLHKELVRSNSEPSLVLKYLEETQAAAKHLQYHLI